MANRFELTPRNNRRYDAQAEIERRYPEPRTPEQEEARKAALRALDSTVYNFYLQGGRNDLTPSLIGRRRF